MKKDFIDYAMATVLYAVVIFLGAILWWLIFGVQPCG